MQIAMIKCIINPMDDTNLVSAKTLHFKASFVVTPLDFLLCSIMFLYSPVSIIVIEDSLHVLDRSTSDFSPLHGTVLKFLPVWHVYSVG